MLEKYEICRGLFHGFDWSRWTTGTPRAAAGAAAGRAGAHPAQEDGKDRLLEGRDRAVARRSRWPCRTTRRWRIRDDVGFFQAVRAVLAKTRAGERQADDELDHAIRQIVSRAVASDEVIDIFAAAGLKKPDISILSDEFLAEVRGMPQRNLAVELLQKLLNDEIKHAVAKQRRAGAVVRRDAGAVDRAATRTAPSRRRRSSRS